MSHIAEIYDRHPETGEPLDVIDAILFCSDACHRDYMGDDYDGWNGCHENEWPEYCANCGVVLASLNDPCKCANRNVVVNRFPVLGAPVLCEHGNVEQAPQEWLTR